MQKALLVAEKPDLMRKIEKVYNANKNKIPYTIEFLSQRGHLVELLSPSEMDEDLKHWRWESLPIEPEDYDGWKYKVIQQKKTGKFMTPQERYNEIQQAINSDEYDFVIHAGDPDQEGQLLVDIVLAHIGNTLPVKRFWTNDLTDTHILNALLDLKDNKEPMLANLLDAAYVRQHSDWRFGMNISRAASLKMDYKVACGRVKTPILAIVCKREEEIRNFIPKTVYGVKAIYEEGFDGTLFNPKEIVPEDEEKKDGIVWFDTAEEANELISGLGNKGTIRQYITKRTESFAPKLYKLATAQIDAGKMGYGDMETLEAIQSLYEQEYLSYPRTDCEYLSSNEDFEDILDALGELDDYSSVCEKIVADDITRVRKSKKWINDKALEDAGHSALRPTTKVPDLDELTNIQSDIYKMIVKRFLAIFLPPLVQDKTAIVVDIDGSMFSTKGSTVISPGYTEFLGKTQNDVILPKHEKGDILNVDKFEATERTSSCPKRYTSPDIISVCENPAKFLNDESLKKLGKKLKIGTPATRSSIIRELIDKNQYLEEVKEKKSAYIVPTPLGEKIIKNLDGLLITRVDMTAEWEEDLESIRAGKLKAKEIDEKMRRGVREMLDEIKQRNMSTLGNPRNVVGTCPKCGGDIIEKEYKNGSSGFYCTNYKAGCPSIFKKAFGLEFNVDDFKKFALGEEVVKDNRTFYFEKDSRKVMERGKSTNIMCPMCGANLTETDDRYMCDCGFSTRKIVAGHKLTGNELKALEINGKTEPLDDLVNKKGEKFTASLTVDKKKMCLAFDFNTEALATDVLCPVCKNEYMSESEKNYSCNCGFKIWKTVAGHTLTKEEIRRLAEYGKTDVIEDFKSKKGNNFSARLVVKKRKKAVEFEFENKD